MRRNEQFIAFCKCCLCHFRVLERASDCRSLQQQTGGCSSSSCAHQDSRRPHTSTSSSTAVNWNGHTAGAHRRDGRAMGRILLWKHPAAAAAATIGGAPVPNSSSRLRWASRDSRPSSVGGMPSVLRPLLTGASGAMLAKVVLPKS